MQGPTAEVCVPHNGDIIRRGVLDISLYLVSGWTNINKGDSQRSFAQVLNDNAFQEITSGRFTGMTSEYVAQRFPDYSAELVDSENGEMTRQQVRLRI